MISPSQVTGLGACAIWRSWNVQCRRLRKLGRSLLIRGPGPNRSRSWIAIMLSMPCGPTQVPGTENNWDLQMRWRLWYMYLYITNIYIYIHTYAYTVYMCVCVIISICSLALCDHVELGHVSTSAFEPRCTEGKRASVSWKLPWKLTISDSGFRQHHVPRCSFQRG